MRNNNIPNDLYQLLSKYNVVIPLIQRDYVQGSNKVISESILTDIYDAIQNQSVVDFNFIYGKIENDTFYPIDGQQRLTTLFMFYLYAFRNSNDNILNKFHYEARNSSNDFINSLIKNRSQIFNNVAKPSQIIENAYWYNVNWSYDPTVKSVKSILNSISVKFKDVAELDTKLKSEKCPITFQFTELDEKYGNANELYIKLNSRGKILNSFENFKAQLIERAVKIKYDKLEEFTKKFDGSWYELIWNYLKDKENGIQKVDEIYYNFFKLVFISEKIDIEKSNYLENINNDIYDNILTLLNYMSSDNVSQVIKNITLDTLNEINFVNKAYFYFTYKFIQKCTDNTKFEACMRVIHNLIANTQIDKDEILSNCEIGIDTIIANFEDIIEYLSKCDISEIKGFDGYQKSEEQQKARIIKNNVSFLEVIKSAESNEYFDGQIGSALKMSELGKNGDIELFKRYWKKIEIFFGGKKSNYSNNQLLRRTLLSIKDYTISVSDYKTFCVDDPKELKRTPSFRRLFLNDSGFIKGFLDRIDINKPIENQLNDILESQKANITIDDWRYCFIDCPELFKDMSASFLRIKHNNNEVIIIPNKSSTGKNLNVYLQYIVHKLQGKIDFYSDGEQGTYGDRFITNKKIIIRQNNKQLQIFDMDNNLIKSFDIKDNVLSEIYEYLLENNKVK